MGLIQLFEPQAINTLTTFFCPLVGRIRRLLWTHFISQPKHVVGTKRSVSMKQFF